jgi:hypothetical protein
VGVCDGPSKDEIEDIEKDITALTTEADVTQSWTHSSAPPTTTIPATPPLTHSMCCVVSNFAALKYLLLDFSLWRRTKVKIFLFFLSLSHIHTLFA